MERARRDAITSADPYTGLVLAASRKERKKDG
jgi:hypothetical protein